MTGPQVIYAGVPFSITCNLAVRFPGQITWSRLGSSIPSSASSVGNNLNFTNPQPGDSGDYTCGYVNSSATSTSQTITIQPCESVCGGGECVCGGVLVVECDDVMCMCGRSMGVVYRDRVSICSCVLSLQSSHQCQVLETLSPLAQSSISPVMLAQGTVPLWSGLKMAPPPSPRVPWLVAMF